MDDGNSTILLRGEKAEEAQINIGKSIIEEAPRRVCKGGDELETREGETSKVTKERNYVVKRLEPSILGGTSQRKKKAVPGSKKVNHAKRGCLCRSGGPWGRNPLKPGSVIPGDAQKKKKKESSETIQKSGGKGRKCQQKKKTKESKRPISAIIDPTASISRAAPGYEKGEGKKKSGRGESA